MKKRKLRVVKGSPARHYVDAEGRYLGGWSGAECDIPAAIQVPYAPEFAEQRWNGIEWEAAPRAEALAELARLDVLVSRYLEDRMEDGRPVNLSQEQQEAIGRKQQLRQQLKELGT